MPLSVQQNYYVATINAEINKSFCHEGAFNPFSCKRPPESDVSTVDSNAPSNKPLSLVQISALAFLRLKDKSRFKELPKPTQAKLIQDALSQSGDLRKEDIPTLFKNSPLDWKVEVLKNTLIHRPVHRHLVRIATNGEAPFDLNMQPSNKQFAEAFKSEFPYYTDVNVWFALRALLHQSNANAEATIEDAAKEILINYLDSYQAIPTVPNKRQALLDDYLASKGPKKSAEEALLEICFLFMMKNTPEEQRDALANKLLWLRVRTQPKEALRDLPLVITEKVMYVASNALQNIVFKFFFAALVLFCYGQVSKALQSYLKNTVTPFIAHKAMVHLPSSIIRALNKTITLAQPILRYAPHVSIGCWLINATQRAPASIQPTLKKIQYAALTIALWPFILVIAGLIMRRDLIVYTFITSQRTGTLIEEKAGDYKVIHVGKRLERVKNLWVECAMQYQLPQPA